MRATYPGDAWMVGLDFWELGPNAGGFHHSSGTVIPVELAKALGRALLECAEAIEAGESAECPECGNQYPGKTDPYDCDRCADAQEENNA